MSADNDNSPEDEDDDEDDDNETPERTSFFERMIQDTLDSAGVGSVTVIDDAGNETIHFGSGSIDPKLLENRNLVRRSAQKDAVLANKLRLLVQSLNDTIREADKEGLKIEISGRADSITFGGHYVPQLDITLSRPL